MPTTRSLDENSEFQKGFNDAMLRRTIGASSSVNSFYLTGWTNAKRKPQGIAA